MAELVCLGHRSTHHKILQLNHVCHMFNCGEQQCYLQMKMCWRCPMQWNFDLVQVRCLLILSSAMKPCNLYRRGATAARTREKLHTNGLYVGGWGDDSGKSVPTGKSFRFVCACVEFWKLFLTEFLEIISWCHWKQFFKMPRHREVCKRVQNLFIYIYVSDENF